MSDEDEAAGRAARTREWFGLEVLSLVVVLIAGAGARYWLSTALPFDGRELEILAGAAHPESGLRVPMIMFVGLALFFGYVIVRRSAGIGPAFAALLLLQTSLLFQEQALRLRLSTLLAPLLFGLLLYWRSRRPPTRLPARIRQACLVLALLFAARGAWLAATLPERLDDIRAASDANVGAFMASLTDCGLELPAELRSVMACELAWPQSHSLRQQELGMQHAARLGDSCQRVVSEADWPDERSGKRVLLDRAGACLLVVPDGPLVAVAEQTLR